MEASVPEALLEFDNGPTYKAMMIALLLASLLCGVATIQAILYFCVNKAEPVGHKIAVGLLWLLDIVHLCFFFHATFVYVLIQPRIGMVPYIWSFKIHVFAEVFILSATKVMYLIRIWKLRKLTAVWVPITLGLILILEFVFGVLLAANIATLDFLHELINAPFEWTAYVFMSTTSATDILIGGVLMYTLARSGSNLNWTNSSWTMLSAYLLNTGIITGVFSLITLISFSAGNVWNSFFIVSVIVLPQLYVNCFLSMMNASFYFQTKNNPSRKFSFPYFPSTQDRFEIPILDIVAHSGDPESDPIYMSRGLRSYTSTSLGSTMRFDSSPVTEKSMANSADYTINEVGLPLFAPEKRVSEEPPKKKVPMQIQVLTTKEQHSTVIPMRRFK